MPSEGKDVKIFRILREKNIRYLYHFTNAQNLKSILRYGLIPRKELEELIDDSKLFKECINDPIRLDGCPDAVCVSIGFPNYKMFCQHRRSKENKYKDWVIISINAEILCDIPCAFCWKNASDKEMAELLSKKETRDAMGSPEALRDMFEDHEGDPKRDSWLRSDFPTNPQAEVLIFGEIPVKDFGYLYFQNDAILEQYRPVFSYKKPAYWEPYLFQSRKDAYKWKKRY